MAIPTTTIGAYPKPDYVQLPDWFDNPDKANPTEGWSEAMAVMGDNARDIINRGIREAVADQVAAGIDIPTDGEIPRENYIHYHCRHLDGIDFENLTEQPVRGGNYTARLPTINSQVEARDPFLVEDWKVASEVTDRPVKITLPGPMTMGDTVADAYYGDPETRGRHLARAINAEVLALADAGCTVIQIDEPVFARQPERALGYGIEHLEIVLDGCPDHVTRAVHMCCGYPDRLDNPDYPKARREAYFELADAMNASSVDQISIEDAHRHNDLSLLERFDKTAIIFGVVAIARSRVEAVDEITTRLQQALNHIDANRLIAAPDCGLGLLGRDLALAKLQNLSAAARQTG